MARLLSHRLFWFFRKDAALDLSDPAQMDGYVQQILRHGRFEDVRQLLREVGPQRLRQALKRVKNFLPIDVRRFWGDFFGDH